MIWVEDAWKKADDNPRQDVLARASRQAKLDADYATRRMSLEDWRTLTEELSQQTATGKPFGRPA